MTDTTIGLPDGRVGDTPVLWFHGGPGSRFEPKATAGDGHFSVVRHVPEVLAEMIS